MIGSLDRRSFLKSAAAAGAAVGIGTAPNTVLTAAEEKKPLFKISLAEWSFHRTLNDKNTTMTNLDFPVVAKRDFGIEGVEYVNQFFMDKARDTAYLTELKKRCEVNGVRSVLIMCDNEGDLGAPDGAARTKAIDNHHKWIEAAKFLGCHSIRVNARSDGSYEEQQKLAADGLSRLNEYGVQYGIGVIVENHGGLSSNGEWLAGVMKMVDNKNCGTLPDFGNFKVSDKEDYDRYKGVAELMPYAKGVSAKSHVFDAQGNEKEIDYFKMMKIVVDAGYHGFVGIEWEGEKPDEVEGVRLTQRLLERVRDKLTT
jgi:L-ribulose-5-phosphate 3-epimerase